MYLNKKKRIAVCFCGAMDRVLSIRRQYGLSHEMINQLTHITQTFFKLFTNSTLLT